MDEFYIYYLLIEVNANVWHERVNTYSFDISQNSLFIPKQLVSSYLTITFQRAQEAISSFVSNHVIVFICDGWL